MDCYKCDVPNSADEEYFKQRCSRCNKILKYQLVKKVLELDRIYLSESNRNKTGRPPKIDAGLAYEIKWHYQNTAELNSYGKLTKQYGVSKGTISNILKPKIKQKKNTKNL